MASQAPQNSSNAQPNLTNAGLSCCPVCGHEGWSDGSLSQHRRGTSAHAAHLRSIKLEVQLFRSKETHGQPVRKDGNCSCHYFSLWGHDWVRVRFDDCINTVGLHPAMLYTPRIYPDAKLARPKPYETKPVTCDHDGCFFLPREHPHSSGEVLYHLELGPPNEEAQNQAAHEYDQLTTQQFHITSRDVRMASELCLAAYAPRESVDMLRRGFLSDKRERETPFGTGFHSVGDWLRVTVRDADTHFLVAVTRRGAETTIWISFPGTSDYQDVMTDINFASTRGTLGQVHKGFWTLISKVREQIEELAGQATVFGGNGNNVRVFFTGHSLGGAVAHLCVLHLLGQRSGAWHGLQIASIAFGSPFVCDSEAVSTINNGQQASRFLTVINDGDVVPMVLIYSATIALAKGNVTSFINKVQPLLSALGTVHRGVAVTADLLKDVPSWLNKVPGWMSPLQGFFLSTAPVYQPLGPYIKLAELNGAVTASRLIEHQHIVDAVVNMGVYEGARCIERHSMEVYCDALRTCTDLGVPQRHDNVHIEYRGEVTTEPLTLDMYEPVIEGVQVTIESRERARVRLTGHQLGLLQLRHNSDVVVAVRSQDRWFDWNLTPLKGAKIQASAIASDAVVLLVEESELAALLQLNVNQHFRVVLRSCLQVPGGPPRIVCSPNVSRESEHIPDSERVYENPLKLNELAIASLTSELLLHLALKKACEPLMSDDRPQGGGVWPPVHDTYRWERVLKGYRTLGILLELITYSASHAAATQLVACIRDCIASVRGWIHVEQVDKDYDEDDHRVRHFTRLRQATHDMFLLVFRQLSNTRPFNAPATPALSRFSTFFGSAASQGQPVQGYVGILALLLGQLGGNPQSCADDPHRLENAIVELLGNEPLRRAALLNTERPTWIDAADFKACLDWRFPDRSSPELLREPKQQAFHMLRLICLVHDLRCELLGQQLLQPPMLQLQSNQRDNLPEVD